MMERDLKNSEKSMTYKRAFLYSILLDTIFLLFLGYALKNILPPFVHQEMKISLAVDMPQSLNSGGSGGNEGGYTPSRSEDLVETPTEKSLTLPHQETKVTDKYKEQKSTLKENTSNKTPLPTKGSRTTGKRGGQGYGEGSGMGHGTGEKTGEGLGTGSGTGNGIGSGEGDGIGSGTEKGYIDISGYLNRLDENKVYPPMAVKRGLTGTAIFNVTFSAQGDIIAVELIESSGEKILDKAAEKLIYEGGQIINTTGETTVETIPIHYNLN